MYSSLYKQIVRTHSWFPTLRLRRHYTRQNCSLDATRILTELQNDAWQPHTPHQVFNANYVSCMAFCVCCASVCVCMCKCRWTALDRSRKQQCTLSLSLPHIHTWGLRSSVGSARPLPMALSLCGAACCGNKKHRTKRERISDINCMKVRSQLLGDKTNVSWLKSEKRSGWSFHLSFVFFTFYCFFFPLGKDIKKCFHQIFSYSCRKYTVSSSDWLMLYQRICDIRQKSLPWFWLEWQIRLLDHSCWRTGECRSKKVTKLHNSLLNRDSRIIQETQVHVCV